MKIRKGFTVRHVAGEAIIVAEGIDMVDFNRMISLNHSALLLWNELSGKEFTTDDAVALLTSHYDVDEATATADVSSLLKEWKENGLLE